MSTANREKRKQAKRKARETKRGGGRHRKWKAIISAGGVSEFAAMDDIAQRWFGLGEEWWKEHTMESLKEGRDALILDQRKATMPDLYYTLAAEGIQEPEVFLRLRELPAGGRSAKYKDGRTVRGYEDGISCFPACRTRGGHVLLGLGDRLHKQLVTLMGLSGRTAYLIGGEVVGVGGDGEPVLRNAYNREALQPLHFVATRTPSWTVEAWNANRIPENLASGIGGFAVERSTAWKQ